jgi:hypothetical protein
VHDTAQVVGDRLRQLQAAETGKMSDSLLARKYFDGIYIPAGLIILGTIIVKKEWTPYAVIVAIALGSLKYFNNRTPLPLWSLSPPATNLPPRQCPRRSSSPTHSKSLS